MIPTPDNPASPQASALTLDAAIRAPCTDSHPSSLSSALVSPAAASSSSIQLASSSSDAAPMSTDGVQSVFGSPNLIPAAAGSVTMLPTQATLDSATGAAFSASDQSHSSMLSSPTLCASVPSNGALPSSNHFGLSFPSEAPVPGSCLPHALSAIDHSSSAAPPTSVHPSASLGTQSPSSPSSYPLFMYNNSLGGVVQPPHGVQHQQMHQQQQHFQEQPAVQPSAYASAQMQQQMYLLQQQQRILQHQQQQSALMAAASFEQRQQQQHQARSIPIQHLQYMQPQQQQQSTIPGAYQGPSTLVPGQMGPPIFLGQSIMHAPQHQHQQQALTESALRRFSSDSSHFSQPASSSHSPVPQPNASVPMSPSTPASELLDPTEASNMSASSSSTVTSAALAPTTTTSPLAAPISAPPITRVAAAPQTACHGYKWQPDQTNLLMSILAQHPSYREWPMTQRSKLYGQIRERLKDEFGILFTKQQIRGKINTVHQKHALWQKKKYLGEVMGRANAGEPSPTHPGFDPNLFPSPSPTTPTSPMHQLALASPPSHMQQFSHNHPPSHPPPMMQPQYLPGHNPHPNANQLAAAQQPALVQQQFAPVPPPPGMFVMQPTSLAHPNQSQFAPLSNSAQFVQPAGHAPPLTADPLLTFTPLPVLGGHDSAGASAVVASDQQVGLQGPAPATSTDSWPQQMHQAPAAPQSGADDTGFADAV